MRVKKSQYKKVFVGLSGGVDSAVSAALLQKAGYDVTGVFIKVWSPDFLPCTWREDRRDAMRVCAHLGIPFLTLDLEDEYKKEVVDYMIAEYKAGRTPNPDVMCNKEIKFGAFYNFAMKRGAEYVATGHYVRTDPKTGTLVEGRDKGKDQSYFLWTLTKDQLSHVLFPVGDMPKAEVRKLAKKFKLPNAEKKDSQGLCFLGKVDMREFLSHFLRPKSGKVLNVQGKVIGTHDGAVFFTLGQRHGFTVENKQTESEALYVISKDVRANTITVSSLKPDDTENLGRTEVSIHKANWVEEPDEKKTYRIRFRYHQEPLAGKVIRKGNDTTLELLESFVGASAGQSAVIYDGERMIGGGVIL